MKTIWMILHLDTPTNDISKIKEAYAEQSKKCNPEENPEEFNELYNAYKQAIKYAKSQNMVKEETASTEKNIENKKDILIKREIKNKDKKEEKQKELKEKLVEKEEKVIEIKPKEEKISSEEIKNEEKIIDVKPLEKYEDRKLNEDDIAIEEVDEGIEQFSKINNNNEENKIKMMIEKINSYLVGEFTEKKKKELKNLVNSPEFLEVMKKENFQLELSKCLNKQKNIKRNALLIIKKQYSKYYKKNSNEKIATSLNNYFIKSFSNEFIMKNGKVNFIFIICIICSIVPNVLKILINSEYFIGEYITTVEELKENEMLTYDKNYKVSFEIPEGYTVDSSSNNFITIKKDGEAYISIKTENNTVEKYYKKEKDYYNSYSSNVSFSDIYTKEYNNKTYYCFKEIYQEYLEKYPQICYEISDKNIYVIHLYNEEFSIEQIDDLFKIKVEYNRK